MPRDMMENERSTAINPSESVEEKVSLSDRFGLWIGFHNMDQDTFLAIIEAYYKSSKYLLKKINLNQRHLNGLSLEVLDQEEWRGNFQDLAVKTLKFLI